LLRILYGEAIQNHIAMIAYSGNLLPEDGSAPDINREMKVSNLNARGGYSSTAAWEATRVKLAQHLPSEDFASSLPITGT
jgi:hypothetical protein